MLAEPLVDGRDFPVAPRGEDGERGGNRGNDQLHPSSGCSSGCCTVLLAGLVLAVLAVLAVLQASRRRRRHPGQAHLRGLQQKHQQKYSTPVAYISVLDQERLLRLNKDAVQYAAFLQAEERDLLLRSGVVLWAPGSTNSCNRRAAYLMGEPTSAQSLPAMLPSPQVDILEEGERERMRPTACEGFRFLQASGRTSIFCDSG